MKRQLADSMKSLPSLAIPGFVVAIGVATILDVRGIYEPAWLLPILNLLFLFIPGCIIAYVSVQGYLISGSFPLLLFGSAAMMYGTSSGIAGWMIGVLGAVDAGIVLHNTGSAIGGDPECVERLARGRGVGGVRPHLSAGKDPSALCADWADSSLGLSCYQPARPDTDVCPARRRLHDDTGSGARDCCRRVRGLGAPLLEAIPRTAV